MSLWSQLAAQALSSESRSFPGLAGGSLPYQSHRAAAGPW